MGRFIESRGAKEWASLVAQMAESSCNPGDPGSIPGLGRSLGEENGYPPSYSCLENSMDRRGWQAIIRGITNKQTGLRD